MAIGFFRVIYSWGTAVSEDLSLHSGAARRWCHSRVSIRKNMDAVSISEYRIAMFGCTRRMHRKFAHVKRGNMAKSKSGPAPPPQTKWGGGVAGFRASGNKPETSGTEPSCGRWSGAFPPSLIASRSCQYAMRYSATKLSVLCPDTRLRDQNNEKSILLAHWSISSLTEMFSDAKKNPWYRD